MARIVALAAALLAAGASSANAQSVDVGDLWRLLRHLPPATAQPDRPSARAILPTFGSSPATGFTIGVGASLARYFGDPATTHISSMLASGSFSQKRQTSINAKFDAFTGDNRMHLAGDNRLSWTSSTTYGLGTSAPPEAGIGAKYTRVRVFETALFQIHHHLFAGGGLALNIHSDVAPRDEHSAWDTSPPTLYAEKHGFDPVSQTAVGPAAAIEWNSRDNPIDASRGWLAAATYRAFVKDFLGGDSTWQELVVDVRHFVPLGGRRRTLALWFYSDDVVTGVAPYFDLPAITSDTYGRTGRGYAGGRFRGTGMVYGEAEYRQPLRRDNLLGMVLFANTSTYSDRDSGERLGDSFAPAGGAGLRVLFSKRSGANLCVDYGVGRESHGFYLALQEAF
jgi:hypothetical protein